MARVGQRGGAEEVGRIPNPVGKDATMDTFTRTVSDFCLQLAQGQKIQGVVAATAGAVDGRGKSYQVANQHLGVMATGPWRQNVEATLGCELWLINDAEAFLIGLAEEDRLPRRGAVGGLVVGTGLGFAMTRDGRWWKPARDLNYLGAVSTPVGTFDEVASATKAAARAGGDLVRFLGDPAFAEDRADYWRGLRRILASASILYRLDHVVVGGGLIAACQAAEVDASALLAEGLEDFFPPGLRVPQVMAAPKGNEMALIGALALAEGNAAAEMIRFGASFADLETEKVPRYGVIDALEAEEIVHTLLQAECDAAPALGEETFCMAAVATRMTAALRAGGRVILVGAGTSGRLAALDAVEIPCTFGEDPTRFVAVIAGGIADACLTVEGDGEEDHSGVADLLLLQPGSQDVVIGISASGTAFFVRSALSCARSRGATTVLLHEASLPDVSFFDIPIRLHSGDEAVPGSTRLKAGTATKKILNTLSTAAQILLGRVREGRMINLQCTNDKLRRRAERILIELNGLSPAAARERLRRHQYRLKEALDE